jgi:hypothetical protein
LFWRAALSLSDDPKRDANMAADKRAATGHYSNTKRNGKHKHGSWNTTDERERQPTSESGRFRMDEALRRPQKGQGESKVIAYKCAHCGKVTRTRWQSDAPPLANWGAQLVNSWQSGAQLVCRWQSGVRDDKLAQARSSGHMNRLLDNVTRIQDDVTDVKVRRLLFSLGLCHL